MLILSTLFLVVVAKLSFDHMQTRSFQTEFEARKTDPTHSDLFDNLDIEIDLHTRNRLAAECDNIVLHDRAQPKDVPEGTNPCFLVFRTLPAVPEKPEPTLVETVWNALSGLMPRELKDNR